MKPVLFPSPNGNHILSVNPLFEACRIGLALLKNILPCCLFFLELLKKIRAILYPPSRAVDDGYSSINRKFFPMPSGLIPEDPRLATVTSAYRVDRHPLDISPFRSFQRHRCHTFFPQLDCVHSGNTLRSRSIERDQLRCLVSVF